jgi:putative transposase
MPPMVEETIRRVVAAQPGMTLQELLHHDITLADALYFLIATERVYVDLDAVPLAEPARVPLFPDRDTALAYAHVQETVAGASVPGIPLACGVAVLWDGRAWTIVHVGETTVGLRGEGSAWTDGSSPLL